MKNVSFIVLFVAMAIGLGFKLAAACEPCREEHDLVSSMQAAEFILLVEKTRDGTRNDDGYGWGGPDWIEVKIKGSLKGRRLPPIIKINSYEGQCLRGFKLDKGKEYVVLLREIQSAKTQFRFDVVLKGCGTKSLPVEEDYIVVDGARWTVEEFESLLYL